jgi:hypothetical protein
VRGQHAVIEDQVDPRPGDEGRQASQKIDRLKDEVARAVRPQLPRS